MFAVDRRLKLTHPVHHVFRPVHGHARQHGRQRGPAQHPARTSARESPACSGSSRPTRCSSPASCSPAARSATSTAANGSSSSASSVFTSGSLLCGLAPSLHWLVAGRAIQGIGAAALLPGTLSILITTFPDPKERAQAIGLWAGVSGLALAAGPVIGGVLVDTLGWQSVFFLNVPIGILAFIVALRIVRESSQPGGSHARPAGPGPCRRSRWARSSYALIEANNYGWTSPLILTLFAVGIVTQLAFLSVETRSTQPDAAAAASSATRPSPPARWSPG